MAPTHVDQPAEPGVVIATCNRIGHLSDYASLRGIKSRIFLGIRRAIFPLIHTEDVLEGRLPSSDAITELAPIAPRHIATGLIALLRSEADASTLSTSPMGLSANCFGSTSVKTPTLANARSSR